MTRPYFWTLCRANKYTRDCNIFMMKRNLQVSESWYLWVGVNSVFGLEGRRGTSRQWTSSCWRNGWIPHRRYLKASQRSNCLFPLISITEAQTLPSVCGVPYKKLMSKLHLSRAREGHLSRVRDRSKQPSHFHILCNSALVLQKNDNSLNFDCKKEYHVL